MAQTPPRPPHCCSAATDKVQLAGVLTRLLSPAGVLLTASVGKLALTNGTPSSTVGEVGDKEGEVVDMLATTSLAVCGVAGTSTGTGVTSALGGTGGAGMLALTV